jgi:hypothetical protein
MAEYLIQGSTLTAIADAIRDKTGETEQIEVQDMPNKISTLISLVDYVNNKATTIADYAYYGDTKFKSVSFENVTEIGAYAFCTDIGSCCSLEYGNFPLAKIVGNYAFGYCEHLTSINLPVATKLSEGAFANCYISNISLPECTSIGMVAFRACKNLVSVDAPKVSSLDRAAFMDCTSLKNISLPSLNYSFSYGWFTGCTSLESASLPLVTALGESTFSSCTSLKNVDIPMARILKPAAFYGCTNLEKIELPGFKNDCGIGKAAFQGCSNLSSIVCPNLTSVPAIDDITVFANTPIADGSGFIYVPDALVDSCKTAEYWSTYASQIKPLSEYVSE